MAARTIALLLLGFALHTTYSVPVPPCGAPLPLPPCGGLPPPPPPPVPCAGPSPPAPLAPEVYSQNNGNPLIVMAPPSPPPPPSAPIPIPAPPPPPTPAPCLPPPPPPCGPVPPPPPPPPPPPCGPSPPPPPPPCGPIVLPAPAPYPSPAPYSPGGPLIGAPLPPSAVAEDLSTAQALADQSILESAQLDAAAPSSPAQPCSVETSTEVVQHPGETFVHQPGEILISQPPTRLVINHAPYIVRPSPVVLNQGGKTITNAYIRKIMPGQIQYRPCVVRIVKPIEKKVLIDKPAGSGGSQNYVSQPPIPNPCDYALAPYAAAPLPPLAPPPAPAPAPAPTAYGAIDASSVLSPSAATAADQASLAALLSQANLSAPSAPGEIQSADGTILAALPAPSCGC